MEAPASSVRYPVSTRALEKKKLGLPYTQLLDNGGGAQHRSGFKGKHRVFALSCLIISSVYFSKGRTSFIGVSYVESREGLSVLIECLVVEFNKLFCIGVRSDTEKGKSRKNSKAGSLNSDSHSARRRTSDSGEVWMETLNMSVTRLARDEVCIAAQQENAPRVCRSGSQALTGHCD